MNELRIDSEKTLVAEREAEVAEMATNTSAIDPIVVGHPETGQNQSPKRRNNESASLVDKDQSVGELFETLDQGEKPRRT